MVEWVLEAWRSLPSEIIVKSFKVCALSSSLDGSEDGQLMCIKHGPCGDLLERLQCIREEECDSFENNAEEDIMLEDIAELAIDSDHEDDELEIADV